MVALVQVVKRSRALALNRLSRLNGLNGLNGLYRFSHLTTFIMFVIVTSLSACNSTQVLNQGYIFDQQALDATPVGSSREQVLLSLGTPSITQAGDNDTLDAFYYISQTRKRSFAFQKLTLVNQSILAVYFDENSTVSRVANYSLRDGKVFDMISQTTPTSGKERGFLAGILVGLGAGTTNAPPRGR